MKFLLSAAFFRNLWLPFYLVIFCFGTKQVSMGCGPSRKHAFVRRVTARGNRKKNHVSSSNLFFLVCLWLRTPRSKNKKRRCCVFLLKYMSGRGDSNARPLRPERSALPTALLPVNYTRMMAPDFKFDCKVTKKYYYDNYFLEKIMILWFFSTKKFCQFKNNA